MTSFLDGPAAGVVLALRRAPVLLRVVCAAPPGLFGADAPPVKWDALDQPEDTANPGETIHLYRLAEKPTYLHIKAQRRSSSGWYAMARYKHLPEPIDDATLRDNALWAAWCEANRERLDLTAAERGACNK